jgi:hypothetical protein
MPSHSRGSLRMKSNGQRDDVAMMRMPGYGALNPIFRFAS